MTLPKKITPCPIKDALVEIRFDTNIEHEAVFGLLYNSLKDDFRKVEKLPIMQFPDELRNSEQFRFKPHYVLPGKEISIQIGPEVLTISSNQIYIGWAKFAGNIDSVLKRVEKTGIISDVKRLGIRYVNFFKDDIFQKAKTTITINEKEIGYKNTYVRTEIEKDGFVNTLQIANNAVVNGEVGSVIDIDTFKESGLEDFFNNSNSIIREGHKIEKELFFQLLNEDYLKTFNPEY